MVTKIFTDNDALSDYLAEQMIELILEKMKNKRRPVFKDEEYRIISTILTKELANV